MSKFFQDWEAEPIIRYTIDVPKPAGDGTALEKPSIKVRAQSKLDKLLLTQHRLLVQQLYNATHQRLANSSDL